MKFVDFLAGFHNWVADKDFVWWPFSFLRPEKNSPMTFKIVFQLTLAFGGLAFVMFTALALMNNALSFKYVVATLASCFLGFFFWFSIITKPLWNRRALK